MNRYDDENKIIRDFQNSLKSSVYFFPNETEEAINVFESIHNPSKWNLWIDSSGKSDPPPDFYSNKFSLMMDVMRIDDHGFIDSKGNNQNYVNAGESQLYEELRKNGIIDAFPNAEIIINAKTTLPTDEDHNYERYGANFKRIITNHINKIPLYKQNHSNCKTVFFVMDESSAYIECENLESALKARAIRSAVKSRPHMFWNDNLFLNVIRNADIDYFIWFAPFKVLQIVDSGFTLPKVVVIRPKLLTESIGIDYPIGNMLSSEL